MKGDRKVYNQIKAFNERIAEIERRYGRDSILYQRYEEHILRLVPEEYREYNKAGRIRLKQGYKAQDVFKNGGELQNTFEKLRSLPTYGQYKKRLKKDFEKEYGEGEPTDEELREFERLRQDVREALEDGEFKQLYNNASEQERSIWQGNSGNLSYTELKEMLEELGVDFE